MLCIVYNNNTELEKQQQLLQRQRAFLRTRSFSVS